MGASAVGGGVDGLVAAHEVLDESGNLVRDAFEEFLTN